MNVELEERMRAWHAESDFTNVLEAAFREYGPPIYRYLVQRMRGSDGADEVFAQLGEDAWRGIEGFEFRSSIWTWMHTLARNGAHRYERRPANQRARHTGQSRIEELVWEVRTATLPYLKTEVKDRFAELQLELDEADRELLLLRVHQRLSWNEIAQVVSGEALDPARLKTESARLRQRFQTIKRRLRSLAESRGLLDAADNP